MLSAMVCSLRGSVCIYQGEELGLPEAGLPFEALRDPYGIAFWPNFKGRDGCRTPMPWRDTPDGGFTTGTPWLPVPAEHLPLAVSRQETDYGSPLNALRRFLRWRSRHPALSRGDIRFIELPEPVLAFTRSLDSECIVAAFNLADRPQAAALPALGPIAPLDDHGLSAGRVCGRNLELPPHGVFFARVASEQRPKLG
jgi:alpha-glucosidase